MTDHCSMLGSARTTLVGWYMRTRDTEPSASPTDKINAAICQARPYNAYVLRNWIATERVSALAHKIAKVNIDVLATMTVIPINVN